MQPIARCQLRLKPGSQCRVAMRRGVTGCARIVLRHANLVAVSSQFWKTVRVAQHQAATPTYLSRGIRSTTVKMNEELYLCFTKFGPILAA